PQARLARVGRARGAGVDRAGRGRHDRPAGRPSSQARRPGAAHRTDQRRPRDHARGTGRAPAPRARGYRGRRVKRTAARRPARKPRRKPRAAAPQAPRDADPLAGLALRPLLERYCELAGVKQAALGPHHADPPSSDPEAVEPTLPVRDGTIKRRATRLAVHPVGRLVARVVLRAGAGVEEAVVETDVYDLSAGAPVGADLAAAFRELEAGRVPPADPAGAGAATVPAREAGELLRSEEHTSELQSPCN